jgi:hypothetical protein
VHAAAQKGARVAADRGIPTYTADTTGPIGRVLGNWAVAVGCLVEAVGRFVRRIELSVGPSGDDELSWQQHYTIPKASRSHAQRHAHKPAGAAAPASLSRGLMAVRHWNDRACDGLPSAHQSDPAPPRRSALLSPLNTHSQAAVSSSAPQTWTASKRRKQRLLESRCCKNLPSSPRTSLFLPLFPVQLKGLVRSL